MDAVGFKFKTHHMFLIVVLAVFYCLTAAADDTSELTSDTKIGDIVLFGSYLQYSDSSDKQGIKWKVLDKDGNELLLITEKCIASMPYQQTIPVADDVELETTWAECSLRDWLNQVFYLEAFSELEQKRIIEKAISTPANEDFDIRGGDDTKDCVFLLSSDEAGGYFHSKKERMAEATDYAAHGDMEVFLSEFTNTAFWWLRSPGDAENCAQVVGAEGTVAKSGYLVSRFDIGVRPAVWVLAG